MIINHVISELFALEWTGIFGGIKSYKNGEITRDEAMALNDKVGIYQRKNTHEGKRISHMKLYVPTNPRTPNQQSHRFIFKNGVQYWQGLTENGKKAYNKRAKPHNFSGFNLFMREYLNQYKNN